MPEGIPIAERMAQLREENEQLRQAAQAFGELAERLMQQLDAERRLHPPLLDPRARARHRQLQQPMALVPATTNRR